MNKLIFILAAFCFATLAGCAQADFKGSSEVAAENQNASTASNTSGTVAVNPATTPTPTSAGCWPAGNPLCNIGSCGNPYQLCSGGGCAEPADPTARSNGQYCCSDRYKTTYQNSAGDAVPGGYAYCE